MLRALELKLKGAGFDTKTALNGEEALAILSKETVDLILLDLIMPKKDGFAVLAELKEKGITTPVIISSNLSQEDDRQRTKTLGAVDYFVKSDTPIAQVVVRVQRILQDPI